MKKILLVAVLFVSSFSFAQWENPVDFSIGQRWVGTNEAGWYGSVRTYFPLDFELFGVTPYLTPEVGIDYNSLQPFVTLELAVDAEYGTLGAWVTYMGGVPRINLEYRVCFLSDRCDE